MENWKSYYYFIIHIKLPIKISSCWIVREDIRKILYFRELILYKIRETGKKGTGYDTWIIYAPKINNDSDKYKCKEENSRRNQIRNDRKLEIVIKSKNS